MNKNNLTTKQKDLVDTIVTTGCSIAEASQKVGYAKSIEDTDQIDILEHEFFNIILEKLGVDNA